MPISADQWRAVTGLNNVRRPRQVGIKPRYMQQETCGDNDKLSHHLEPDTTKDTTGGGARSKRSRVKKGSRRKDRSRRPERDKFRDDSTISIRTILWPSLLALCLAVIVPTLWGLESGPTAVVVVTPEANSTIPGVFESSSVLGVQLLQSFISVVVMLLLLLSGDVETNPGPIVPELTVNVLTKELQILSKPIEFGIQLNIPQHQLDIIKKDHLSDTDGQKIALFEFISQNYRVLGITWKTIADALEGVGYGDLALSIREKYCQSEQGGKCPPAVLSDLPASSSYSSSTPDQGKSDDSCLTSYGELLKREYEMLALPSEELLGHRTKVCRLAMIENEEERRHAVDEEFVRQAITGNIDDILHTKTPVELKDIFEGLPKDRKMILFEGAPGAGKSSLSLDICKKWNEGELFQEYKAVILVRLRDPQVQKAKTLADLLPACCNVARAQQVETAIKAVHGRDVLWILDGWDEFPDNLKNEHSLLRNIVYLANHKGAVIVTSRPVSSVKLHPIASKRIEILGFTPKDLEEFFMNRLNGDSQSAQTLLEKIKQHPEVESSCYLPLHAAFIVDTFLMKRQAFPTTQYGIFESVVIRCISRHQIKQGKEGLQSLDKIPDHLMSSFEAVCELAYQGILENKVIFTESDLPPGFTPLDLLQEVESMVAFEKDCSKTYNFLHLSIEEFLAAHHLATKKPYEQFWLFRGLMEDKRCLPMLTFYAAKTKLSALGITDFFSSVSKNVLNARNEVDAYNGLVSLLFAFRCICEAENPSICEPLAKTLTGKMFSSLRKTHVSPYTLLDYYSIGSFWALSSSIDIGDVIIVDFSVNDQECTMLMKGMLKSIKDAINIISPLSIQLQSSETSRIGQSGAASIAEVLRDTKLLHTLEMSNLETPNMMEHVLLEGVQHSLSLHTLQLHLVCRPLRRWGFWEPVGDSDILTVVGQYLEQMLQNNSSLQVLILTGNAGIVAHNIAHGLQRNCTLKRLEISDSDSSVHRRKQPLRHYSGPFSSELEPFSEALTSNTSLQVLKLSLGLVSDDDVNYIAQGLQRNCSLETLEISDCEITVRGGKPLSKALGTNMSLQCLRISRSEISCNAISHISKGIKENVILKELDLSNCGITSKGIEALSKALIANKTLEVLKLTSNKISDKGASYIANALERNSTLKELQIKDCGITTHGTGVLMVVLLEDTARSLKTKHTSVLGRGLSINSFQRNTTKTSEASKGRHVTCPLKTLCVSVLPDEGINMLGDLLAVESSIESLDISSGDQRFRSDISCITSALKDNKSLKFLYMSQSLILPIDGLQLLCDVLSANKTLIKVYIDSEAMRSGMLNFSTSLLEKNTSLQELRLPHTVHEFYDRKELQDRVNNARRRTGQAMEDIKILKPLPPVVRSHYGIVPGLADRGSRMSLYQETWPMAV